MACSSSIAIRGACNETSLQDRGTQHPAQLAPLTHDGFGGRRRRDRDAALRRLRALYLLGPRDDKRPARGALERPPQRLLPLRQRQPGRVRYRRLQAGDAAHRPGRANTPAAERAHADAIARWHRRQLLGRERGLEDLPRRGTACANGTSTAPGTPSSPTIVFPTRTRRAG